LSLVGQSLIHHAAGNRLADLDGEFLQFRELGTPGHSLSPVHLLEEMFCNPLDEVLLVMHCSNRIRLVSHP